MNQCRQLALFAPYLRFCAIFLVFAYVFPFCTIVCLLRAAVALCVFARKNVRYVLFVSKVEKCRQDNQRPTLCSAFVRFYGQIGSRLSCTTER